MCRFRLFASVAMTAWLWAGPVLADKFNPSCTTVPRHLWLSLQALQTKVEGQGYRVQKSRLTSTCAAFEVLKDDGAPIELFVDPTNGEIRGRAKLQHASDAATAAQGV